MVRSFILSFYSSFSSYTRLLMPHISTMTSSSASMPHRYSVIPPYLLENIANSTVNPEHIRVSARHTLQRMASQSTPTSLDHHNNHHHQNNHNLHHRQGVIPDFLLQNIADSDRNDDTTRAHAKHTLDLTRDVLGSAEDTIEVRALQQGKRHPTGLGVDVANSGFFRRRILPTDTRRR